MTDTPLSEDDRYPPSGLFVAGSGPGGILLLLVENFPVLGVYVWGVLSGLTVHGGSAERNKTEVVGLTINVRYETGVKLPSTIRNSPRVRVRPGRRSP